MMLNELLQWALLAFLLVFVVGLTRQLGQFMVATREQRAETQGPDTGKHLPRGSLDDGDRRQLAATMDERGVSAAAVLVVDERCVGCDQLLADLEESGVPDGAPLLVFTRTDSDHHLARLRAIADIVVTDPDRCRRLDIKTTPFTMLVDRDLRVLEKGVARTLSSQLEIWQHSTSRAVPELAGITGTKGGAE